MTMRWMRPARSEQTAAAAKPGFVELFTPKLVTVLREGYGLRHFRSDAVAGLTVAVVALPLSMAIAIASGIAPAQGLYTAIVGGFFVSLFGGSRFQIGGPAGAFIVLVAATVQMHGLEGLILATIISGILLLAIGFLQLGTFIKFIPYPVTVGFTAGIAAIIFASQIKPLLGLTLEAPEPGPLVEKLPVLWHALQGWNGASLGLALLTISCILLLKARRPHWPVLLIAIALSSAVTVLADLDVATIGSEFGGIPAALPPVAIPQIGWDKFVAVLPNAAAFALLGAIESLLSAVVADGMTGRRHRSNCELVGQGIANIASGLAGGFCVTGTIARTATNVRAGAHGPVAGLLHAVALLAFILIAAPLAGFIPLASLAGVLAVVAWDMIEKHAFIMLLRASRGDALVLLSTFLLTMFRDLTEAIIVGFALGSVLFIYRMSKEIGIDTHAPLVPPDRADGSGNMRSSYDPRSVADPEILVYRISGALFFGASAAIGAVLDRIADTHRLLVIDLEAVSFIDSTAANVIGNLAQRAAHSGVICVLTSAAPAVRQTLSTYGVAPPLVSYAACASDAVNDYRADPSSSRSGLSDGDAASVEVFSSDGFSGVNQK